MGKVIQLKTKESIEPKKIIGEESVYLWTRCQTCGELQIIKATKINDEYFFDCNCERCKIPIQIFMRELTNKELAYMSEYNNHNIKTVSLESYISNKLCEETEKILASRKDS
jgi:hypothetical protein